MLASQVSLIAAVVEAVQGDEVAKGLLGDPVRVWDQPPKGAALPYVQVGGCESRAVRGDSGAVEHGLSLSCVSRSIELGEVRAVAAAVEGALAGLVLEGLVSCDVRVVQVRRGGTGRGEASVRVRVVVDLG